MYWLQTKFGYHRRKRRKQNLDELPNDAFHWTGRLGWVSLVVVMPVCVFVCLSPSLKFLCMSLTGQHRPLSSQAPHSSAHLPLTFCSLSTPFLLPLPFCSPSAPLPLPFRLPSAPLKLTFRSPSAFLPHPPPLKEKNKLKLKLKSRQPKKIAIRNVILKKTKQIVLVLLSAVVQGVSVSGVRDLLL